MNRFNGKEPCEQLLFLLSGAGLHGGGHTRRAPAEFGGGFDSCVTVETAGGVEVELWIKWKTEPRPVHFPYVELSREFKKVEKSLQRIAIFAAPVISRRMAELCAAHGWSWFDMAGNCHIVAPGRLYIERQGFKSARKIAKAEVNLGTPEASRVIRVVLNSDTWRFWLTQRDLQGQCSPGVSIGLVNKLMRYMVDQRYLVEDESKTYQMSDPVGLLTAWREAYQFKRVHQLHLFTLKRVKDVELSLIEVGPHLDPKVAYASFSAAEIQAPSVRQAKTWLMVSSDYVEEVVRILNAKEVDSGSNLVLLVPPDDGPFYKASRVGSSQLECTHSIQTYADVSQFEGRGQEAAEALLDQIIKPDWEKIIGKRDE